MNSCPVCFSNKLVKNASVAGQEIYCGDCRRIIVSASMGFIFTGAGEDKYEPCKGPENDPRPGYKGPGDRAHCYLYDPGNDKEEASAKAKANASAYSTKHRREKGKAAAKLAKYISSLNYFDGVSSPALGMPASSPAENMAQAPGVQQNVPNNATDPTQAFSDTPTTANPLSVTAPNGVQPGELNGANPLNSATTSSKRIAELVKELTGDPIDVRTYMGPGFCTTHNKIDECKQQD